MAGTLGRPVDGSVADGRRQAGSGIACSRGRARLNCSSQGQRRGRCRINRRAERVSCPARAKNRRRRVLVVTICSPRPSRAVQRARLCAITCTASQYRENSPFPHQFNDVGLLVLQRRFFDLVSFWPEIASRKARPQGCHGRGQVAMKRRSRSLSCEASL